MLRLPQKFTHKSFFSQNATHRIVNQQSPKSIYQKHGSIKQSMFQDYESGIKMIAAMPQVYFKKQPSVSVDKNQKKPFVSKKKDIHSLVQKHYRRLIQSQIEDITRLIKKEQTLRIKTQKSSGKPTQRQIARKQRRRASLKTQLCPKITRSMQLSQARNKLFLMKQPTIYKFGNKRLFKRDDASRIISDELIDKLLMKKNTLKGLKLKKVSLGQQVRIYEYQRQLSPLKTPSSIKTTKRPQKSTRSIIYQKRLQQRIEPWAQNQQEYQQAV